MRAITRFTTMQRDRATAWGRLKKSFKSLFIRQATKSDPLGHVLFRWTDKDPFTVRDLLNGGVSIMGRVGSGKTSGSGRWIGEAIINYPPSGGLILCAKPEDKAMWRRIFHNADRQADLLVFEPAGDLRFNFLDFEMRHGGHTRNVTKCITTIGESLRSSDTNGREDGDFWEREQERMIYNAVEIVKLATGKVTAPELQQFIHNAAQSPADISNPSWRGKFHSQCIRRAFGAKKSPIEAHDYQLAEEYWLAEFPGMADRTRSSILVGVLGILHVFNTGIAREMISTTTNVTPDEMFAGKWLLINLPPSEWGDIGNFINAGWKYLTQRHVLRRHAEPGDRINVIWCDEAQQFVNSFDSHYLAQCRSHYGSMVFLTQSLHSYYTALKGTAGRHQANGLLTNFHHKIFHAVGDEETATWASGLIGKDLQTFIGGSMDPQVDLFDTFMGRSRFNGSFSQHFEHVLQPNVFMNGLRTGGSANRYVVDAIALKSGEPFANGKNWMWTSFSQR